jgi:NAD(P)H-dependent FMN reductase
VPEPVAIVALCGSLRPGSTNAAVLRTAAAAAPEGVSVRSFDGMGELPHFDPDLDAEPLPPPVAELRAAIGAADAVLICTPEYAGALPGSFKNLLDWTVGGSEMYEKPVAWINAASVAAPTGGVDAHESLAKVLGYVGAAVIAEACARIPLSRQLVDDDGLIRDPDVVGQIVAVLREIQERL